MTSKARRREKPLTKFGKLNGQIRIACGTLSPSLRKGDARVKSTNVVEPYRAFLIHPSAENYLAAVLALASASDDSSPSMLSMEHACQNGQYETVSRLSSQWTRNFALSPRFHRLSAIAARELGDLDEAEMERFACETCLDAILVTGEGSPSAPYLVAQRSDSQEVLAKLGFKPIRQMRIENNGRLCDVFEVRSKSKKNEMVWFLLASEIVVTPGKASSPERQSTRKLKPRIRHKVPVEMR